MASLARTKDIRIAYYDPEPRRTYIKKFEQRRERFNEIQDIESNSNGPQWNKSILTTLSEQVREISKR